MNACENPDILRVIFFGKELINIVKIVVPIALIILGMIDFSKSVVSNDEAANKKNTILFLEDDGETLENFFYEFDRNFESLSQLPDFKFVKGIVIGRCQDISSMNDEKWEFILKRDKIKNIPVVYGVDFGHVSPMITFPIGGKCILDVSSSVKIRVER